MNLLFGFFRSPQVVEPARLDEGDRAIRAAEVEAGSGRVLIQAGVFAINVVPEPASLVLLGIGLLAPMGAWWLRLGRARAAG